MCIEFDNFENLLVFEGCAGMLRELKKVEAFDSDLISESFL